MVDDWLSLELGDFCLERVVRLSSSDDLSSSQGMLTSNVKYKFFDDHIWLSVGYRKTRSSFTRVQRLCCCMSILYLMMITNAMWFGKGNATGNQAGIVIGPISMTVMQIYTSLMSSVIVLPPILIITTIFSNAAERKSTNPKVGNHAGLSAADRANSNKKKKRKLPWWTIFFAYTLVVLAIAASAFFTILYAFEWGKSKSEQWLVTFCLGFFESVVLVQPIKVRVESSANSLAFFMLSLCFLGSDYCNPSHIPL